MFGLVKKDPVKTRAEEEYTGIVTQHYEAS